MSTEIPTQPLTESPTAKYRPSTAADKEKSKRMNKERWEKEKAAKSFNPLNSQGLSTKELEQETRKLIKQAAYVEAGEYAQACMAKVKRSKDDSLRLAILYDKAYPKEQPDGLTLHVPAKLLANLSIAFGINLQPQPQPVVATPDPVEIPSTPSSQAIDSIETVQ